ncbi:hypothetical protein [Bradyrhizobium sp. SZCCHNRI2007]|uniref:hypothetical protein n=1 Tax=Bradyrhizobium sp. SZCCHNRI2007 TaxID=3057281 RepID=UPI0028EC375B|nr:hypothetical protein [Bradyrhizobium sp. SZCCHNRI2007]
MEILLLWLFFAFVVGIAANNRGRSGLGWFLIACVISPLLAIVLVLALSNLRRERRDEELLRLAAARQPPPLPKASLGGKATRVSIVRDEPFRPDGVLSGIPYRVLRNGEIEAVMQGQLIRFADYDQFVSMAPSADA